MALNQDQRKFLRLLDDLWLRRTRDLRRVVTGPGVASKKKFTKEMRNKQRDKMLDAAYDALLKKYGKKELYQVTDKCHKRYIKGYGIQDRFERMWTWVERKLSGPIVYAFWRGDRCLYVGKGNTPDRLWSYKRSIFLKEAKFLEVWEVCTRSALPKAECLATHLFEPKHNDVMPARKKWSKKCPICSKMRKIKREIRSLFKMKG